MGGKTAEKIMEVPSLDPIASVREEVLGKKLDAIEVQFKEDYDIDKADMRESVQHLDLA